MRFYVLLSLLGAAISLAFQSFGAIITGSIQRANMTGYQTNVVFTPETKIWDGTNQVSAVPVRTVATNGVYSVTLYHGNYLVTVGNNAADSFRIAVPNTTNRYAIADLRTAPTAYVLEDDPELEMKRNKNLPNGYAGLDGSGMLSAQVLTTNAGPQYEFIANDVGGGTTFAVPRTWDVTRPPFNAPLDGTNAATAEIAAALTFIGTAGGGTLYFPVGTYLVDPTTGLDVPNDSVIEFAPGAQMIMTATTNTAYAFFRAHAKTNVVFRFVHIEADKTLQTVDSFAGMGIDIRNAQNIRLEKCEIYNAWADCLYVGGSLGSTDVKASHCLFSGAGRNGVSVVSGRRISFDHCDFSDTLTPILSTQPQAGCDVEPNSGGTIRQVRFSQCNFFNNYGGGLYVNRGAGSLVEDVEIDGCTSSGNNGSGTGFGIQVAFASRVNVMGGHLTENGWGAMGNASTNLTWTGVNSSSNLLDGFYFERGEYASMRGCQSANNGRNGVKITGSSGMWPRGFLLDGNTITGNTEDGIECLAGSGHSIVGNVVSRNGQENIYIQDTDAARVERNESLAAGQTTSATYSGVRLAGVCRRTIVRGNNLKISDRWHIGTAQSGAAGSITLAADAAPKDDFYNGYLVELTAGTGSGQVNVISDFVGSTLVATVTTNWTTPPDNTSVYTVRLANKPGYSLRVASTCTGSLISGNDAYNGGTWSVLDTSTYYSAGNDGVSLANFLIGGSDVPSAYLLVTGATARVVLDRNGLDRTNAVYFSRGGTLEWVFGAISNVFGLFQGGGTAKPTISADSSSYVAFHGLPTNAAQVSIEDNNAQLRLAHDGGTAVADFWVNAAKRLDLLINGSTVATFTSNRVGINTNAPRVALDIYGDVYVNGTNIVDVALSAAGGGVSAGDFTSGTNTVTTNLQAQIDALELSGGDVSESTLINTNDLILAATRSERTNHVAAAVQTGTNYTDAAALAQGTASTNHANSVAATTVQVGTNYTDAKVLDQGTASTNHASAVMQTSTNYANTVAATTVQVLTNYSRTATNDLAAAARAELLSRSTENTNYTAAVAATLQPKTVVTNYAYASDLVLPMSSLDVRAAVTNAASGNINLLVTNVVDGATASMRVTADGTERTVSMFWQSGVTVTPITTNATINATNLYVPANKTGFIGIRCAGTNFVTVVTAASP